MAQTVTIPGERLAGLSADLFVKVQHGGITLDELALFLKRQDPFERQLITVDYGFSVEQMIAAGRYDWKNSDITAERFSIKGSGKVTFETKLFHFNRLISSEEAVKQIVSNDPANPWQVAQIEHGLAYGATYPEEQRQFPIVALGSSCQLYGVRCVPILYAVGSERDLNLDDCDGEWNAGDRFLAVRQVSVRPPAD